MVGGLCRVYDGCTAVHVTGQTYLRPRASDWIIFVYLIDEAKTKLDMYVSKTVSCIFFYGLSIAGFCGSGGGGGVVEKSREAQR